MTDAEKVAAMSAILNRHDNEINADDGGERPFNEPGEVIETMWAVINGDQPKLARDGWLPA